MYTIYSISAPRLQCMNRLFANHSDFLLHHILFVGSIAAHKRWTPIPFQKQKGGVQESANSLVPSILEIFNCCELGGEISRFVEIERRGSHPISPRGGALVGDDNVCNSLPSKPVPFSNPVSDTLANTFSIT